MLWKRFFFAGKSYSNIPCNRWKETKLNMRTIKNRKLFCIKYGTCLKLCLFYID